MSRAIPSVKRWRVTFTNGTRIIIWAPTRRLALLNTRLGEGCWGAVKSVGLIRSRVRS
jgi:hypothetical protein